MLKKYPRRRLLVIILLLVISCFVISALIVEIRSISPKEQSNEQPVLTNNTLAPNNTPKSVLVGLNYGSTVFDYTSLQAQQTLLGRRYDIVRVPVSWQGVQNWAASSHEPNNTEYAISNNGQIPHITVTVPDNWHTMAFNLRNNGSTRRNQVDQFARSLQNFMPGPFLISLDDSPELHRNDRLGNSPQDYADMFCAFYQAFHAQNNDKARFVYESSNNSYSNDSDVGARFYPGDQCVDWIGTQSMNSFSGDNPANWIGLTSILRSNTKANMKWYDWATTDWTDRGLNFNNPTRYGEVTNLDGHQEAKQAKGKKPLILTSYSTREDYTNPSRKAEWLTQSVSEISSNLSSVKAFEYYDFNDYQSKTAVCYGSDWSMNSTVQTSGKINCSNFDTRQFIHSNNGISYQAWQRLALSNSYYVSKGLSEGQSNSSAAQKRFTYFLSQK